VSHGRVSVDPEGGSMHEWEYPCTEGRRTKRGRGVCHGGVGLAMVRVCKRGKEHCQSEEGVDMGREGMNEERGSTHDG
jgi:hypothetical protein